MSKFTKIEKLAKHIHQLLLVALCLAPLSLTSANVAASNVFSPSSSMTEEEANAHSAKSDSLDDMLNDHIVRSQSFGTLLLSHFKLHLSDSDISKSSSHPKTGDPTEKYDFAGGDIRYGSDNTIMHQAYNLEGSKGQSIVYSVAGNNLTIFASDDSDCHGDELSSVTYHLHRIGNQHHGCKELILYPLKYHLEDKHGAYVIPTSERSSHPLNLHVKTLAWEHHNENVDSDF